MNPDETPDNESDSDMNPDETPEYYQPISAVEDEDSDQVSSDEDRASDFHRLPNGISPLEINDDDVEEDSSEDLDSAVLRAFRAAGVEDWIRLF